MSTPKETLQKLHSAMVTTAVTPEEIQLANGMIASYLEDASKALAEAMEVARQSGVPFKWEVMSDKTEGDPVIVTFDPKEEERILIEQGKEEWDSSDCYEQDYDSSWESSSNTC